MTRKKPLRRTDSGVATIEMLGVLPIAIMIAGAILQLFLVGYAGVSAESAARSAAREASRGTSFSTAASNAERDSSAIFRPEVTVTSGDATQSGEEPGVPGGAGYDSVTARAEMTVPFLGFGVEGLDITVKRFAVLPKVEDD